MLSLFYVVPNSNFDSDYPFGSAQTHSGSLGTHPVTAYAGFAWPGGEGRPPHAWAIELIPLDMGVDTLLMNFAFWSVVALLLMRRASRRPGCGLVGFG